MKKIMLFRECLEMFLKRSSREGLKCHVQKVAFES